MSCVFPGVDEVLANAFLSQSMLIKEDLPTFDLPMKAYSGNIGSGHFLGSELLMRNSADKIFMS